MIVVLNGASSAGKTTLARALQDAWPEPALSWGIDAVVTALPRRYLGELWSTEVFRYSYAADGTISAIGPGPYGETLVRGLHAAVAGLARAGVHVAVAGAQRHDLTVDTSRADPAGCTAQVLAALPGAPRRRSPADTAAGCC